MRHRNRSGRPIAVWRDVAFAAGLCILITGCGRASGPQTTTGNSGVPGTPQAPTATTPLQPTTTPPTPLPTGPFATYTNTAYQYSIPYPSSWIVDGSTTATSDYFIVYNYDYHQQQFQTPYLPLPLLKVEVAAMPNPSHLAPLDFFQQQIAQPGQAGPTPTIVTSQAVQVAGRAAEEVVTKSGPSGNPDITYVVPDGDTMLEVTQINSENGQPDPVFAEMVAGLVIAG